MDFTLSEYINALLDKRYAAETKGMMKALRQMSESAEVQRALDALETHVAGLAGNTLKMADPELSQALAVIQKEMNFAQGLITDVAPNLAESGAEVANRAATAKLFGNVTDNLLLQNVNPLEASVYKMFLKLAAERNIPFSSPNPAVMARKFVASQAWIDRMDGWGDGYSALIADSIKQGLDSGWSPTRTAREIRRYATEMPRYAAENITRTTQMHSYREATAEIERRMGQFIERKVRIAALDLRTCPACIALHGTEIPVGQAVEDHFNGRCDAIYIPPGGEMPDYMQSMSTPGHRNFVPFQNGEDWFAGLSEQQQRQILGPGKFEIYKSGTPLSEFWHTHTDSVFGDMPLVKPLWMLEGYGSYAEKMASQVAYRTYLPPIDRVVNRFGERPATVEEVERFKRRVLGMPDGIRRLEPADPIYRTQYKLDGTPVVADDWVGLGIIDMEQRMPDGSAYHYKGKIMLAEEFLETPTQDHEYIHSLLFRNTTIRDGYMFDGKYTPRDLFLHAQGAGDTLGEQLTMVLTSYKENRNDWIDEIASVYRFGESMDRAKAERMVDDAISFLRGVGIW